jgi:hypothetical protein
MKHCTIYQFLHSDALLDHLHWMALGHIKYLAKYSAKAITATHKDAFVRRQRSLDWSSFERPLLIDLSRHVGSLCGKDFKVS